MAKENVRKFYTELAENKELQEKLKKAEKDFDGDGSDKEAVVQEVLIPVAKEAGYDITVEDIRTYEREKAADKGISEEELENVSGGSGYCEFLGFGTGGGVCLAVGANGDTEDGYETGYGIYVCCFVGIGGGGW